MGKVVCPRCGGAFEKTLRSGYSKKYCSEKCAKRFHGTVEQRFWAKTRKETGGCWLWIGSVNNYGYPQFYENHKVLKAHRWAYERWVGPIPDGKILMHSCDTPNCVNPEHLSPGTNAENSADAARKGRMRNGKNVLSEEMQKLMLEMLRLCIPKDRIAIALGVSPKTVRRYAADTTFQVRE